jgi:hypothetical protein
MDSGENVFKWPDYVVLSSILLGFMSIGLYFRFTGNRQRTTSVSGSLDSPGSGGTFLVVSSPTHYFKTLFSPTF